MNKKVMQRILLLLIFLGFSSQDMFAAGLLKKAKDAASNLVASVMPEEDYDAEDDRAERAAKAVDPGTTEAVDPGSESGTTSAELSTTLEAGTSVAVDSSSSDVVAKSGKAKRSKRDRDVSPAPVTPVNPATLEADITKLTEKLHAITESLKAEQEEVAQTVGQTEQLFREVQEGDESVVKKYEDVVSGQVSDLAKELDRLERELSEKTVKGNEDRRREKAESQAKYQAKEAEIKARVEAVKAEVATIEKEVRSQTRKLNERSIELSAKVSGSTMLLTRVSESLGKLEGDELKTKMTREVWKLRDELTSYQDDIAKAQKRADQLSELTAATHAEALGDATAGAAS